MSFFKRSQIIRVFLFSFTFFISSFFMAFSADINARPQQVDLELNHLIELEVESSINSRLNYLNFHSYYIVESISPYLTLTSFSSTFPNQPRIIENEEVTYYEYSLEDKRNGKINFSSSFKFISTPNFPKITTKQIYSANSASQNEDIKEFTRFTDQIDTNLELQEKALELARGEDDTLVIATKIANWVQQEIEYDLSTVFENPDQSATEIFESKQGVCKELSIVYASMLRTLQIPVRINSGFAYTTSEEIIDLVGDNWGGHAWVEVLIGDEWVPFDLTYEQYGYVDASHIPLQQTVDMEELGVRVEMSASNYNIVPNSLDSDFKFEVNSLEELGSSFNNINSNLQSEFLLYRSESNVLINATIDNNEEFYQIVPIELVFPDEIEAKSKTSTLVVLPPLASKTINFVLKMPKDMNGYSFPIALYTKSSQYELQNQISITQNVGGEFIPDSKAQSFLDDIYNSNKQLGEDFLSYDDTTKNLSQLNSENFSNENQIIRSILDDFNTDEQCEIKNLQSITKYEISCNISLIEEALKSSNIDINTIRLCSLTNCSSTNTSSFNRKKILTTQTGVDIATQLKINSITKSFFIDPPQLPSLDIKTKVNDSKVTFKSNMNTSVQDAQIRVVVGELEFFLDKDKSQHSVELSDGEYVGIAYLQVNSQTTASKLTSFEIEKKGLIKTTIEYIRQFLNF